MADHTLTGHVSYPATMTVDSTTQLLRDTISKRRLVATADSLPEERTFFGKIRARLGTCERPQKLLEWFQAVTFAHFYRARDDANHADILLPDERKAAVAHPRHGVPAGGVRVGLTAKQATKLTIAVDNAAQPWNLVDDHTSATHLWGSH